MCFLPLSSRGHFPKSGKKEEHVRQLQFNFSQGSPFACYRLFNLRGWLPPSSIWSLLPSLRNGPIFSLGSSWWVHACREPAVPSSWLPDNLLPVRPLGPLGFLKLSAIPWNHKNFRSCHFPTFLHPSESGSVCKMGKGLTGLSGGWDFFHQHLVLMSYFAHVPVFHSIMFSVWLYAKYILEIDGFIKIDGLIITV